MSVEGGNLDSFSSRLLMFIEAVRLPVENIYSKCLNENAAALLNDLDSS